MLARFVLRSSEPGGFACSRVVPPCSPAPPFPFLAFRAAEAQQPSTLRIAMTLADIPVTDGAPDQGTEGIRFMGYTMYDPLVMWDLSSATEPAKLVPGLATKWYQDPADPSKWIFELRQGVKFHHGAPFTADDVIFSLDRTLDDKSPAFDRLGRSVLIAAVWPMVGYRKIDDHKVELQTNGVDTVMPSLLNRFTIASADNFEKVGKDWQAYRKSPSGTGPWKMKAWTPRERAELERNTDYWNKDRIPKTERMVLLPIPDVSTRTAALLSGRVDWIEAPAPDSLDKLRAGGCKIETNAIPHMWPYTLSMLPGAPTADIRVRKAMNLAIDRDAIVKVLNGLAVPAVGCVPTDHPWFGTPELQDQVRSGRGQEADGRGGLRAGQAAQDQDRDLDLGLGPDVSADHERGDPAAMGRDRHRRRVPGDGLERAAELDAAGRQVAGRPAVSAPST